MLDLACKAFIFVLILISFAKGLEDVSNSKEIIGTDIADGTPKHGPPITSQRRNGIVPICLSSEFDDPEIRQRIKNAIDAIEAVSCVKFKILKSDEANNSSTSCEHLGNPTKQRECQHQTLRGQDGELITVLGYDCMDHKNILHSLLHLLGFKDEVTHPHRDSHVRILWDNLQPKYRHLFTLSDNQSWQHELMEYDTLSIMHFHSHAFTSNGERTILPLNPDNFIIPSNDLSVLDKMKLRVAFEHECNKRKVDDLLGNCQNYIQSGETCPNKVSSETEESGNNDKEGKIKKNVHLTQVFYKGGDNNEVGGDNNEKSGDNNEKGGDNNEEGGDNIEKGGDNNEEGGDNIEKGGDDNEEGGDSIEKGSNSSEDLRPPFFPKADQH